MRTISMKTLTPALWSRSIRTLLPVAAILVFLVAGCAVLKRSPEEALSERAGAFWEARRIGDHITAYQYEEISLNPEMNLQKYLKGRGGIEYQDVEVKEVRLVGPTEGEVLIHMSYTVPVAGISTPIKGDGKDRWVLINGRWYHAWQPPSLFPKKDKDAPSKRAP